ncbi:hypothetical protein BDW62DRAFT_217700 [Aspergillus aurantiobrunneus]
MSGEVTTQPRNLPLLVTESSTKGKTYVVTGANTGLGFEAAKYLVRLGAKQVILAVRSTPSGEAAKQKIEEATGMTEVAHVWALDLSSYDSVKAFAKRASTELCRLDAVIENAAVATPAQKLAEGHLIGITVNVLSTFLLAVLLLPKLKESAEKYGILPHLSIVTSGAGWDAREVWEQIKEDPLVRTNMLPVEQLIVTYPLSKLMDIFAVRELAAHLPLEQGKVVINAVCPELYGRTAEDGSRTLLAGIILGKGSHGAFTSSCEIRNDKIHDWVKTEETKKWQKHLWDIIVKELEAAEPGSVRKALQK